MKRKNDASEQITKGILELKLDSLRVELITDIRNEINETKEELDENAKGYRDEILAKQDQTMGELQTMREENTVGTYQIRELRNTQANHERRIKKLEQVAST